MDISVKKTAETKIIQTKDKVEDIFFFTEVIFYCHVRKFYIEQSDGKSTTQRKNKKVPVTPSPPKIMD